MSNIKSFDSFNEEKKENWIKDAIKKPGALKKSLGKSKDEKITKAEIEKELSKLKKKDKDKEKPGTQLNKADATKKKRLELAKTLKSLKENVDNDMCYTIHDMEQAFTAGEDMANCECEFDFTRRGYSPFSDFEEWIANVYVA